MPVVSWVQMLFGGITAMGYCRGDHLGQCLAHFIMGSAFIGYGIIMTILLLVGQIWLRRTGRTQEFFDSILITAWGIVNTFTEHEWGGPWVGNDLQHTSMGVVWWCAGLLGIWLSRSRGGRPRRNLIPGVVILMTGWAMSAHPQSLPLSAMVHSVFGYTLMAAGATRIIEITFVLKDSRGAGEPISFQYLPPFVRTDRYYPWEILLTQFLATLRIWLPLYGCHGRANAISFRRRSDTCVVLKHYSDADSPTADGINGSANGKMKMPRHRPTDSQQVRDAEEFELEGLISDAEDEEGTTNPKQPNRFNKSTEAV
jgi:hypothetical protein